MSLLHSVRLAMKNERVVVKVGGSLLQIPDLSVRLNKWLRNGSFQTILVPGGGGAADWIRKLDHVYRFSEVTSHWLAIRAMSLNAHVLSEVMGGVSVIECVKDVLFQDGSQIAWILDPQKMLCEKSKSSDRELPCTWDVTGDSIAAWVTHQVSASTLFLLKAAPLGDINCVRQAVARGLLDSYFQTASRGIPRIIYVNFQESDSTPYDLVARKPITNL